MLIVIIIVCVLKVCYLVLVCYFIDNVTFLLSHSGTIRSKKLLGAPGIATRSKDATQQIDANLA